MVVKIKLIIADDHLLFIDGLKRLLEDDLSIHVINIAHDGKQLIELLKSQTPDLILMDINMPKLNGLAAASLISSIYPSIKILMLSTYHEKHLIETAKINGASGYLLKNINRDELLYAIRKVVKGETYFLYGLRKENHGVVIDDPFIQKMNITKRETEIIQFIKMSFTNQQIAEKLFLSVYTIETHRKNIMQKLGLSSPAALMKFIIENDL